MSKTFIDFSRYIVALEKDVASRNYLRELAEQARTIVFRRVKNYEGVSTLSKEAPNLSRLKDLSESYRQYRQGKVQFIVKDGIVRPIQPKPGSTFPSPVTGSFSSANQKRSNLTLTGQMLDSMTFTVRGKQAIVYIPASRRTDSELTNRQVQEFVEQERPFMRLARKEWDILVQDTQTRVFQITRRFF